ncbi:hypothetical protein BDZ45DRAFT_132578 [Acephala macrosclerotiorum]|nr:hypothetical protein BDZ45DRAFT_132578 [Acephala macrosclerotiorum]
MRSLRISSSSNSSLSFHRLIAPSKVVGKMLPLPTISQLTKTIHSVVEIENLWDSDRSRETSIQAKDMRRFHAGLCKLGKLPSSSRNMYVRSFVAVSSVAFCSALITRNHVSSTTNKQISDTMEILKKMESDGYQWHPLPGGVDTVTSPKKDDEISKDNKNKTEKR